MLQKGQGGKEVDQVYADFGSENGFQVPGRVVNIGVKGGEPSAIVKAKKTDLIEGGKKNLQTQHKPGA